MYALVLFKPGSRPEDDGVNRRHEAFIDDLIRRNQVLLGGPWASPHTPFDGAYLLWCDSLVEANEIVGRDPCFRHGCHEPVVVEWDLVGINPGAIEPDIVLTSDHVTE